MDSPSFFDVDARGVYDTEDRPSKRTKIVDSPFTTGSPAPIIRVQTADGDIVPNFKEQDKFSRLQERIADIREWLLKNEAPIEAPHMAPFSETRLSTGEVAEPIVADLWTKQRGPPLPILTPGEGDNAIDFRPMKEEEEDDAIYGESSRNPVSNDFTLRHELIIPSIEGFKTYIQRLNPRLAPFLLERMARQQDNRYRKLLDAKIKHTKEIQLGQCESKGFCSALGGGAKMLSQQKNEDSTSDLTAAGFMTSTYHNSDGRDVPEGFVTPAQFLPGVPLPPVHRLPAEFECPLCFRAKEILKPSDWSKHVHEDLMPFTCTFPECSDPKPYRRKADWVRHENERHRQLEWWTCSIAIPGDSTGRKCGHKCFRRDNFVQHLHREHRLPEPSAIRPLASAVRSHTANKKSNIQGEGESSIFADEVTNLLATCREGTSNRPQSEPCKFCGNVCDSWRKLTVHLAKHMEQISTPILELVRQKDITVEDLESFKESRQHPSWPFPWEAKSNQDIRKSASFRPLRSSPFQLDGLAGTGYRYVQPTSLYEPGRIFNNWPLPSILPSARTDSYGFPYPTPGMMPPNVAPSIFKEPSSFDYPRPSNEFSYHDRRQISPKVQASPWRNNFQYSDLDIDVKSVASVGTFNDSGFYSGDHSSTGSASSLQGIPRAAQQEVLLILVSDGVLQPLFAEATRKVSRERFVRNIKRLIKTYCLDLQGEAQDAREKDATAMLGRHAQWFANRLFDASDPEMISCQKGMDNLKSQKVDKLYMIESHYEKAFPRLVNPTVNFDDNNNDIDSSNSTGSLSSFNEDAVQGVIDYSQFPNLEHIRKFLITGISFQNLRRNVSQFVWPEENEVQNQQPALFAEPEESEKRAQELTSNAAIAKFCRMADDMSSCSRAATQGSRRSSCSNTGPPVKWLPDSSEDKLDSGTQTSNRSPLRSIGLENEVDLERIDSYPNYPSSAVHITPAPALVNPLLYSGPPSPSIYSHSWGNNLVAGITAHTPDPALPCISNDTDEIKYQPHVQLLPQASAPSLQPLGHSTASFQGGSGITRFHEWVPIPDSHFRLTCDDEREYQKHKQIKEEKIDITDGIRRITAPERGISEAVKRKSIEYGRDRWEGVSTFAGIEGQKRRGVSFVTTLLRSY